MDVTLVCMPFAEVHRPSIALGLLQASLAPTGISCNVVYGNFDFAETIGLVAYRAMQSAPTDHLLGEWCFAGLLFPDITPCNEEYLDMVTEIRCQGFPPDVEQRKDLLRWVRAQAEGHVDWLARKIVAQAPRIVGCSSVFQQHCASLALLRRIRELSPDTVLLMGGANCEGEMGAETLQQFPWLDCVVSGEADEMFPELCRLLLDRGRAVVDGPLPDGAIGRSPLRMFSPAPRPVVRDMDALPIPEYRDYFRALHASTLRELVDPELLAESSRGCWWGEKSHCTFCGLNGTGMKHRSKSPERVLSEIGELTARYRTHTLQFVDNILDMSYFETVLPRLAESPVPPALFYEIKSNLKRDQVRLLADAGVRWVQPGIESLDDNVLRLIGKGNSSSMNVQLLKWSSEFGIDAAWNMLCGIPGECDDWYAAMADWMPAIFHLQPPSGLIRVRYDRFSPYHMRPRDFGLTLRPSKAYSYVYPFARESLMRLAYSFEDEADDGHVHRGIHRLPGQRRLQEVLQEWNCVWQNARPVLRVSREGTRLRFTDTRRVARRREWVADELQSEVYGLCDSAQNLASVHKQIAARHGAEVAESAVSAAIGTLRDHKLLLPIQGKLLALGIG
jgi:ribosomal peptide maturation radical SAM protein 1